MCAGGNAARNRAWIPEVVRQKIRTSMLINSTESFSTATENEQDPAPCSWHPFAQDADGYDRSDG
jgi:hypothetical protein